MNQINVETCAIGADRIIALVPGVGHWLAVSEARPSGRARLASAALAYARASDTIISAIYRCADRTTNRSTVVRCRVGGSCRRPGHDASSRDWLHAASDRPDALSSDRR